MFSDTGDAIPMIFLITDGSVGDERHICEVMKAESANKRKICPRIYTFGIGMFHLVYTYHMRRCDALFWCHLVWFLFFLSKKRKGIE